MERYFPQISEPGRRWVRFAGLTVALALLAWFAYVLRAVFTPLLAALAIAYVLNPVVTWCERARRIPRLATVIVAFVLCGALLVGGGFYLGSRTLDRVLSCIGHPRRTHIDQRARRERRSAYDQRSRGHARR